LIFVALVASVELIVKLRCSFYFF